MNSEEYFAREKRRYEIGKKLDRWERVRRRLVRAKISEAILKVYEDKDELVPLDVMKALLKDALDIVEKELEEHEAGLADIKTTTTQGGIGWED